MITVETKALYFYLLISSCVSHHSNFPNMEKLEKAPKEIFTPDIQKVTCLIYSSKQF
jgi:hypothetical protein